MNIDNFEIHFYHFVQKWNGKMLKTKMYSKLTHFSIIGKHSLNWMVDMYEIYIIVSLHAVKSYV